MPSIGIGENFRKKSGKTAQGKINKYCVQSGDRIYPEDGRFSIADSNVAYRLLLKAFAQANIKNPRNAKKATKKVAKKAKKA